MAWVDCNILSPAFVVGSLLVFLPSSPSPEEGTETVGASTSLNFSSAFNCSSIVPAERASSRPPLAPSKILLFTESPSLSKALL